MSTPESTVEGLHERAATGEEILRIDGLVKHFPIRAGLLKRTVGQIHAVDGVDLDRAARARRSASSASRAAARRRSRAR